MTRKCRSPALRSPLLKDARKIASKDSYKPTQIRTAGCKFGCPKDPAILKILRVVNLLQERKRHINIKQIFPVTARVGGGSPDRVARGLPTGGQGSQVYVLCAEPKEYKHFRPGARPGGYRVPAGRIGDRGDREIVYVPNVYVPFPGAITTRSIISTAGWFTVAARLVQTPFFLGIADIFPLKEGATAYKIWGA